MLYRVIQSYTELYRVMRCYSELIMRSCEECGVMRIYTYGIIQSYTKKIELYGGKNTELNRLNFIPFIPIFLVGNSSRRLTGASFMLGISPPGIHISRVLKLEVSLESKRLRGLISGNPGHWNEESKDQPIIPQWATDLNRGAFTSSSKPSHQLNDIPHNYTLSSKRWGALQRTKNQVFHAWYKF